jgi:hypothetical protein
MMRAAIKTLMILFALATATRAADEPAATQPSTPPRTGEFQIAFTQRSPLSDHRKLAARLSMRETAIGPDYDLATQPFEVYVPPDYDPATPQGIIVFLSIEPVASTPVVLHPNFDKDHFIFIVARNGHLAVGEQTGLALDAVYNLKKLYTIDERRVFLMGLGRITQISLCTCDVFDGDLYIWYVGYLRNIPRVTHGTTGASFPPPPPSLLSLAKTRVQIVGYEPDALADPTRNLYDGAMVKDGFQHVYKIALPSMELDPATFEQMRAWLESAPSAVVARSAGEPGTRPATEPAAGEPSRLLALAKSYMSAGRADLAKEKLQLLVEKYPSDPAADQARQLLSQINGP